MSTHSLSTFFFFNDTATTEIYTLSLHDALPIYPEGDARLRVPAREHRLHQRDRLLGAPALLHEHVRLPHHPRSCADAREDRKSTRLNSSHGYISYAVFCLKKKKKKRIIPIATYS